MPDVICLGELLVDFVPEVTGQDLRAAEVFRKAAGGVPANVAVGLARLGVASAFMGQVGDDGFGHFLADAGVDVVPLRFSRAARTAPAFVLLAPDGEREFLFYRNPSADVLFSPEDVDEAAIRGEGAAFRLDRADLRAVARRDFARGRLGRAPPLVRELRSQPVPFALARPRGGPRRAAARPRVRGGRQDR